MAVTPPTLIYNTFKKVSKAEAVVKVPAESVEAYKAAEYWKEFLNITAFDPDAINTPTTHTIAIFRSNDANIIISGTYPGEKIQLFTTTGLLFDTVTADSSLTIIPHTLSKGEIVIINYGNRSIKITI